MTSLLRVATVVALLLSLPSLAAAQTTRPTLPEIAPGSRIWVANSQGLELHGELVNISPDAIEIDTAAGPRRMAMSDVWTIMKKDSNANGFWMGAGVGVLSGVMLGAVSGPVQTKDTNRGFTAGMVIMGGLFYGGIGAWLDSAIEGRELVYRRSTDHDHPTLALAPVASVTGTNKRIGVNGTITWR